MRKTLLAVCVALGLGGCASWDAEGWQTIGEVLKESGQSMSRAMTTCTRYGNMVQCW